MSRFACLALTIGLLGSSSVFVPSTANAQGAAMMELYGEGVHRYFSGDYVGADELLTRVVDSGSSDPRAHIFRGLAREMLGQDSKTDYEIGAQLEAEGKMVVQVGAALTRVQGLTRAKIEKARREARIIAHQQRLLKQAEMASAIEAAQTSPIPPTAEQTAAEGETDPFGDGGLRSDATADAVQPSTAEVDAGTDPFADDAPAPPPADTPAPAPSSDPFGGSDPAPATADPFGSDAPAADPFGGSDGAADPFGSSGGADPFGGN